MQDMSCLELNLGSNEIEMIPRQVFRGIKRINSLHLCNNRITKLNDEMFQGLRKIQILSLDDNKLTG